MNPEIPHQEEIAALLAQGDVEQAQALCLESLELAPEAPQLWYLLGCAAARLGAVSAAITAWESALQLQPDLVACHFELGLLLQTQGEDQRALKHFQAARAFAPDEPLYSRTLAQAYLSLGQREDLMIYVRDLLQHYPEDADTFYLLGAALQLYGRWTDAEAALRQALFLQPEHLLALFQLGQLMLEQHQEEVAAQCFETILALSQQQVVRPAWLARVWSLLGQIWQSQGQISAAANAWRQALELWPDGLAASSLALQLPEVYPDMPAMVVWRENWKHGLQTLMEEAGTLESPLDARLPVPYSLAYQAQVDRQLLEQVADCYRIFLPRQPQRQSATETSVLIWNGISPLWEPGLEALARAWQAQTDLQILTTSPETFERLSQMNLQVQWLPARRDSFQALILGLAPACLIYADLRDSLAYSLALERLADFQAVLCLQPETSGLKTLDAFFSAAVLEPEGAADHYTESLIPLQNWPVFPLPGLLPETWLTRRELHLAELGHIYLCPMHTAKIHPEMDAVFQAILDQDRRALIYLLYPSTSVSYTYLQQRLQQTVTRRNGKIRFLPCDSPAQLLHYLNQADLVLDSPYFGGRASVLWALSLGIPVVSWPGPCMRGRWAAACNQLLDLDALNASALSQLAGIACEIASAEAMRAMLRETLPARVRALWNPEAVVSEIRQVVAEI